MGNTAFFKATLIPTAILTASGAKTVKTLALVNIGATSSQVDVVMKRGGVSHSILSDFTVPGRKTISVFLSKDVDLYLEDGDSIEISASQEQKIHAVLAYE